MYGDGKRERDWLNAHPGGPTQLLGMTCSAAAQQLAFTSKITRYTTCKHYDKTGWMIDVTMMCQANVDSLVIVWYPLLKDPTAPPPKDWPADHCN